MAILKLLQDEARQSIQDYINLYESENDVPKHRQLDIIKLMEKINAANDALLLKDALFEYANGLLPVYFSWVPFYYGSRLGNNLCAVVNQAMYTTNNILQAQLSEARAEKKSAVNDASDQMEGRIVRVEQTCRELTVELKNNQVELKSNQAELARLRKENGYLLKKLQALHQQNTEQQKELAQLRQETESLQKESASLQKLKLSAEEEVVRLRADNQRLLQLVDSVGVEASPTVVLAH